LKLYSHTYYTPYILVVRTQLHVHVSASNSHPQAAYKKVGLGFRYCTKGHIWNQLDPV